MDPFARADKIDGTWFEPGRERCDLTATTPVGYLNCNYTPSALHAGSPVLLTFNELYDLFFEMGMALRSLLTVTPYSEVYTLKETMTISMINHCNDDDLTVMI